MKKINKFLTTPLGDYVKHFLEIILGIWAIEVERTRELVIIDLAFWKQTLAAAFIATLPIILNWLNPNYKNYGKTWKTKENLENNGKQRFSNEAKKK